MRGLRDKLEAIEAKGKRAVDEARKDLEELKVKFLNCFFP
jgi:hypothetical protein